MPFLKYTENTPLHEKIKRINKIANTTVEYIDGLEVVLPEHGIIAGPSRVFSYESLVDREAEYYKPVFGEDNIHFSTQTDFLDVGISEIISKAHLARIEAKDEVKRAYAAGIARTYESISRYILKHAKAAEERGGLYEHIARVCRHIAAEKPDTLEQAIQLYWFIWMLRSTVSPLHMLDKGYYTAPLGRLDLVFYPYYQKDIESGKENRESVGKILAEFIEKLNCTGTGDTLKNLMLGGQNENGEDATNDLTMIFLDCAIESRKAEPHFNVRFHRKSSPEFIEKSIQLILEGHGQGTLYNDEAVIKGLLEYGVPKAIAVNYANDGCEEITIDRDGSIIFHEMEILKALELTLFNGKENPCGSYETKRRWAKALPERVLKTGLELGYQSGDMTSAQSFDEVYSMFLDQFFYQVEKQLDLIKKECIYYQTESISSMVLAGCYRKSFEEGVDPLAEAVKVRCYQLHSGSLPPVADALAAIKKVVFEEKFVTMEQLLEAMSHNYEGYEIVRRKMLTAPKFGNDDNYVDLIASDIAKRFCTTVKSYSLPEGCVVWPGIYSIVFMDDSYIVKASPDGRKAGDPLAVHYSPVPGRAFMGPTAILQSAAKATLYEGIAASPVFLTVSRSLIPENKEGMRLVHSIVVSAIEMGLPILSFAINDIEKMKEAQKNPELHGDLVVRVWGFSAKFVDLTPEMQEHVIQRTVKESLVE